MFAKIVSTTPRASIAIAANPHIIGLTTNNGTTLMFVNVRIPSSGLKQNFYLFPKACRCDYFYSTGNCAEGTGHCECRPEFTPPNCDSCSYGYFGYPNCRPCECNLNGTLGDFCEAKDGYCPCKENYSGKYCKQCADTYYKFPDCLGIFLEPI